MKIVLMNGGLGNQLFQYAFYRYIQIATKDNCYIDDSAFWGNNIEHNGFEIERIFGVKCNLLSRFFDNDVWIEMLNKKQEGISIPQQLLNAGIDIAVIAETDDLVFDGRKIEVCDEYELINQRNNIYYHGYWIMEKWFEKNSEALIEELQFKEIIDAQNKMYLEYIKQKNSVSIHIRRGDFVKLERTLDFSYYIKAVDKVESTFKDAIYFMFSDDLDWCRENYLQLGFEKIKNRMIFIEGNKATDAYIDMQLMASCKHMILANSSFSSFASLLNPNPGKIVVIPAF